MMKVKNLYQLVKSTREKLVKYIPQKYLIDKDLGGSCGFSSVVLNRVLNLAGYNSHLVIGDYKLSGHAWVEINQLRGKRADPYIVDITASQFGLPDIVIDKVQNLHYYSSLVNPAQESDTAYYGFITYYNHEDLIERIIKEVFNEKN